MSKDAAEFHVGDSVLIVDTDIEGELGTIIGVAAGPDGTRYLVVFENGQQAVFRAKNLSHRQ